MKNNLSTVSIENSNTNSGLDSLNWNLEFEPDFYSVTVKLLNLAC